MPRLPILALLLALAPLAQAEKPCTQPDLHTQALRSLALQSKLLAVKVPNQGMDESVPPLLQLQIHAIKDTLTTLATVALECAPADTDPSALQSALAAALDLDKPQPKAQPDASVETAAQEPDQIYGSALAVKVTRPTKLPILLIEFRFAIACGTDSLLLAYQYHHVHWLGAARWQSPDYDHVSGAFGDFFDYLVLQPKSSAHPESSAQPGSSAKPEDAPNWFLAVAHGRPWCTSSMSAFDLDVIQPGQFTGPQHPVYHEGAGYSRNDDPLFKAQPDGFELRMTAYSLDGAILTRPVVYRYRVTAGSPTVSPVERIQPIADNVRDFVDEWLQAPWGEAEKWAAPEGLPTLEPIHRKIQALRDPNVKEWPEFQYGPVHPCTDATSHFQVELRQTTAGQPKPRPAPPTFFQIKQANNAFTLLSDSTVPDPHCKGEDIMTVP